MSKKKSTATKSDKPVILITNDDGVTAPGIAALIEVAKQFGRVVVVAPDAPQSGMGHAITIGKPLRLHPVHLFGDVEAYQCSGTPVDCVKLAVDKVLHKKPDFCFSGINHGSNSSINIIYSGTMSAAMEASIENIPAIGFSYLDYSFDADFSLSQQVASETIHAMIQGKIPQHGLYNVNIPNISLKKYKGIKICRQAKAKWKESFVERLDPHGKKYFWLTGEFQNQDKGKDTDEWALNNNFASVVPVQYDLTDYELFKSIKL
ncbi:MAG: 5'/3'-nucleotidase SurE [Bacteroidetes bacterium]|mgnify:FL=1|nr:5'/3'-nucleotidase SurE [Bacteroidota bacterium]MBK6819757.1 5'/3'-nucleotidase SurE [Bacteroidota bacterium]MBK7039615.1 5'/3'-nucleotidase SurE [Bacteroidota bacterium]MBK7587422.1 5'/3'-nucleotidase SurE [Bacteroidota bacterium]MBK8329822.1 5'/3'-nucleotidase SurE [Bacteroidota bacterium]